MGFRVRQVRQLLGLATATALCALLSGAQAGSAANDLVLQPPKPEFRLARLAYNDSAALGFGRGGFGGGSWTTDAPEAEFHLTQGIRRLTRINTIDPESGSIRDVVLPVQPLDDDLFDYPFLYAAAVGGFHGVHAAGVPGPRGGGDPRQPRGFPRGVGPGPPRADPRHLRADVG